MPWHFQSMVIYNDWRTVSDIARWIVNQIESQPHYDTVLDAVFRTATWLDTDCLFRKQFGSEKLAITVDVSADSGQKHQFKINSTNMDVTQKSSIHITNSSNYLFS